MESKKYSSEIVKQLLENDRYNFWKPDWSKRIVVEWDRSNVFLSHFIKDIRKILGSNAIFEPALNSKPTEYIATINGLKKVE